jgi:hypothetical protein
LYQGDYGGGNSSTFYAPAQAWRRRALRLAASEGILQTCHSSIRTFNTKLSTSHSSAAYFFSQAQGPRRSNLPLISRCVWGRSEDRWSWHPFYLGFLHTHRSDGHSGVGCTTFTSYRLIVKSVLSQLSTSSQLLVSHSQLVL